VGAKRLAVCCWLLAFAAVPANAQESKDVRERFDAAVARMGDREYAQAIDELNSLIVDHPDFHLAYRSLERAHVMLDDVKGARDFFTARLESTPNNAYLHHALGRVTGDDDKAIARMERSIALDPLFAPGYRDLAYFHRKRGTLEQAIAFLSDRRSDTLAGSRAYYGLGYLYSRDHQADAALEALERAIELDDEFDLAYSEKIATSGQAGFYAEVIETSNKLLEIATRNGDSHSLDYAHRTLGNGYLYLGDYWRSLHHLNESLELAQASGEKGRESAALTAIGNVYVTLGEPDKALESHRASYDLAKVSKDPQAEAIALNNIGHDLAEAGRAAESFEYYDEALEIAKKGGYRHDESVVLLNMASAHEYLGERDKAVAEYLVALDLARELDNRSSEGAILRDLGNIEIRRGRFSDAAKYYNETLAVAEATGDIEFRWAAKGGLGRGYENDGDWERAISHYVEAVELYDNARSSGVESMGSGFLDHYPNVYPPLVRLLGKTGRVAKAFEYTQKYKAAGLLQIVSEGQGLVDELMPERFRSRLAELGDEIEAGHASLSAARSDSKPNEDEIRKLERGLAEAELKRAALLEEIRREEGSYVQLASSEPAGLETIRSRVLSEGQTLVEYVVDDDSISAFVLTQTDISHHELPLGSERLQEMLAALSIVFDKDKATDEAARTRVLNSDLADFSIPPAKALYDALVEPIESMLEDGTELVIVPDGLLHYLPFETLVADAEGVQHRYDFDNATFLLEKHAVSYAASASLLDPGLQRQRHAERGLLAFGNPDFGREESDRLPQEFYASALTFSGGVVRGNELLPLPAAEVEVGVIEDVLGVAASRVYAGPQATEAAFKAEAGDYRIVHLATHFLNDDRQPMYSKIVLSQGEASDEDGYLQTYEIFNTRLNADLVVLSACSTGLGKLSKGEGLAGVSRAFLYAGVPSLVVSLWNVDDRATSILMESFYGHLKDGLSKKQALQRAKLDYLRSAPAGKKDPFYWAPFILIGDWQPLELPGNRPSYRSWILLVLVTALIAVTLRRLRTTRSQ
jgi:CHAT domain-containing protein/Tfp pilus assembly protein PilF